MAAILDPGNLSTGVFVCFNNFSSIFMAQPLVKVIYLKVLLPTSSQIKGTTAAAASAAAPLTLAVF